jgi:hypothetical protein
VRINFSGVKWNPLSLLHFLTAQPYNPKTHVSFSGISLSSAEWSSVFTQLGRLHAPNHTIEHLDWSENPLDAILVTFLMNLKALCGLALNFCEYGDDKRRHLLDALGALMRGQRICRFEMQGTKKRQHTFLLRELLSLLADDNTIVELDVSENRLGNEGLSDLQKFVAASNTLQRLSFDGSKPTNAGALLRLFQTLAGRPTVRKVRFPLSDVNLIISKAPAMADSLKDGWRTLMSDISGREVPIERDDDEESVSQRGDWSTSSCCGLGSTETLHADALLVPSWEIEVNLPFPNGFLEWEALKQKYSLTAVSGIDI